MRSKYEFSGSIYEDKARMLDAMAKEWLEASGVRSRDDVIAMDITPDHEVPGWIEAWELDRSDPDDIKRPSHMDRCGYTEADLVDALRRYLEGR